MFWMTVNMPRTLVTCQPFFYGQLRLGTLVQVSLVFESSVVRAFAHGAMGRQINPSWGGPM